MDSKWNEVHGIHVSWCPTWGGKPIVNVWGFGLWKLVEVCLCVGHANKHLRSEYAVTPPVIPQ